MQGECETTGLSPTLPPEREREIRAWSAQMNPETYDLSDADVFSLAYAAHELIIEIDRLRELVSAPRDRGKDQP